MIEAMLWSRMHRRQDALLAWPGYNTRGRAEDLKGSLTVSEVVMEDAILALDGNHL